MSTGKKLLNAGKTLTTIIQWLDHHFFKVVFIGIVFTVLWIFVKGWIADFKHLPSCNSITIDLAGGTVSGLSPAATQDEVKKHFPCYTGATEEGSDLNEGGGIFCKHHKLFFYTHADRIEIRRGFDAKITGIEGQPTLDNLRSLMTSQHNAEEITNDASDNNDTTYQYAMPYGTLTLAERDGEIRSLTISHHNEPPGDTKTPEITEPQSASR